jgi:hypothetical protein
VLSEPPRGALADATRIAGPPARLTARIDHGIHDPAALSLAF